MLHCMLLILNCTAVVLFGVPKSLFSAKLESIIAIFVIVADLLIQLLICYICYTMGSGIKFNRRNKVVFKDNLEQKSLEDSGASLNVNEYE
jgi:hypothetical protein